MSKAKNNGRTKAKKPTDEEVEAARRTAKQAKVAADAEPLDPNEPELQVHPYASAWPMMVGVARDQFVADMKMHGQRTPAIIQQSSGLLIDGRNRKNAADILGWKLKTEVLDIAGEDLPEWIRSMNGVRRMMTKTQDACVAAELATMCRGRNKSANLPIKPMSQSEAAALCGVSLRSVGKAVAIRKSHPKLFEQMKCGETTFGRVLKAISPDVGKEEPEPDDDEPTVPPALDAPEPDAAPVVLPWRVAHRRALHGFLAWRAEWEHLIGLKDAVQNLDAIEARLESIVEAADVQLDALTTEAATQEMER
jgi:hypothetical protein